MKDFVLYLLAGGSADGAGTGGALGLMNLLPFVAIIAIFYFLIIRPQNKKQKETQRMLGALKKGDKVITIGGVHGTITSVDEAGVILKVDDNTKIKFLRSAISNVVSAKDSGKVEKIEEKKDEKGAKEEASATVEGKGEAQNT